MIPFSPSIPTNKKERKHIFGLNRYPHLLSFLFRLFIFTSTCCCYNFFFTFIYCITLKFNSTKYMCNSGNMSDFIELCLFHTSPALPVKAVSRRLEKTGPGQRRVTFIFLSDISTPRVENQPYNRKTLHSTHNIHTATKVEKILL